MVVRKPTSSTMRTLRLQRLNTDKRRAHHRQTKLKYMRNLTQVQAALNGLSHSFASKRMNIPKNTFNMGTVMSMNKKYMTVRLSRKLISQLKHIYRKTLSEQVEYVGVVPFTVGNTRNYVRFNKPTSRTNGQLASVTPTNNELHQYIVYHTHPVPLSVDQLFTLPSEPDFRAYILNYPSIQANIILENQGYYIIDLIETDVMRKPNPANVVALFKKLTSGDRFRKIQVTWRGLGYTRTTRDLWLKFMNNYVNPIMRKQFGISVRYYLWNELGKITLLDKNSL